MLLLLGLGAWFGLYISYRFGGFVWSIHIIWMGCLIWSTIYFIWKGHGCMLWLLYVIIMCKLGPWVWYEQGLEYMLVILVGYM